MHKAHVQHPVGLVQHEDLHTGQIRQPLTNQVVQAAGAGDEHVHPFGHGCGLGALAHAAEHHGVADGGVLAQLGEALADLQSQLPGGGKHQRPHLAAGRAAGRQQLQHGQGKGGGFAGSGLGAAQQVPALQHRRNGLGLNGRRLGVALLFHGAQKGAGKGKFTEIHR